MPENESTTTPAPSLKLGRTVTSEDVVQTLRERYPSGSRYVFMTEVPLCTGTPPRKPFEPIPDNLAPDEYGKAVAERLEARKVRRLDVVVMPCWPSDCGKVERKMPSVDGPITWQENRRPGPWGFEIKVRRSDWRREKATPTKAQPWLDACQRFYFVSSPGVIHWGEVEESFPTAGWVEVTKSGGLVVHREAVVNESGADARAAAMVRAAWQAGQRAAINTRI
jgi:hypothetical protein